MCIRDRARCGAQRGVQEGRALPDSGRRPRPQPRGSGTGLLRQGEAPVLHPDPGGGREAAPPCGERPRQ
eukprot:9463600-Alexandrium_andersonii.AAC.1